MAANYPCPNPQCTAVFDLDAIAGMTTLTCPKCGTSIRFRARPTLPPEGGTEALPSATQPLPLSNQTVAVSPVPDLPEQLDFGPAVVRVPAAPRRTARVRSLPTKILLGSIFTILLGASVFALCWLVLFLIKKPGLRDIVNRDTGNFLYRVPDRSWQEAPEIVQAFKPVQIALSKTSGQPNFLALYYRDYDRRNPKEAELFSEGLAKLRIYFDQLEYELKPRSPADTLAGQPAQVIQFRGITRQPDTVLCFGECWMMSYRGFAYWFITWTPSLGEEDREKSDKAAAEWPALRQRFSTLDAREGWTEAARKTTTFRATRAPIQLQYDDKVWTPEEEAGIELALLGHDPRLSVRARNAGKAAHLKVILLDKKAENLDEAMKLAREDLLERMKEKDTENGTYLYPETKIDEAKDEATRKTEAPKLLGTLEGRVLRLQAVNTADRSRFVVLGVAVLLEGVLVLECDCDHARKSEDDPRRPDRDFWEPEFMAVLDSVRPAKAP